MDIRKYLSPSANKPTQRIQPENRPKAAETKPRKSTPSANGNGLAKERELKLSPTKKLVKSYDSKKAARVVPFSSDESDGESPITGELKSEMKKHVRKAIISSDEEENDFLSASTSHPLKRPSATTMLTAKSHAEVLQRKPSFRDEDASSRDSAHSHISQRQSVERRTARKIIAPDAEPLNDVFSNKKRKAHKAQTATKELTSTNAVESENPKAAKRSKRDGEKYEKSKKDAVVPMEIVDELFSDNKLSKNSEKLKASDINTKPLEKPRNPKIDKISSPIKSEKVATGPHTSKNDNGVTKKTIRFADNKHEDEDDEITYVSPTKRTSPRKRPTVGEKFAPKSKSANKKEEEKPKTWLESLNKGNSTKAPIKVEAEAIVERPKRQIAIERRPPSVDDLPWVDKYKPTQLNQLVGQHTAASPLNKLIGWLRDWPKNNLGAGASQKKARPSPFHAQTDGTSFKAALLSGSPGIGKTTCAVMACRELNLRFVETNASDARNKKTIDAHVAGILDSKQINNYFAKAKTESKVKGIEQVLIMDEVDGMSGNQDRAGIAELIIMIKRTRVPIICICNDRQSTKIRSLANYCFDLRFSRPRAEQIKSRLMTITKRENLNVSPDAMGQIIEASNQDIRQCIHSLQLLAASAASPTAKKFEKKDVSVNIFEAARKLLSNESNLFEKQEMFFSDYSIMPLFVQENYVNLRASRAGNGQHLRSIRQAADYIAFGDIIDKQIRSLGAWNLLVDQAMFSCAMPALVMDGHLTEQLQFPSWFGKYSNANKRQRLMRQLATHTHRKISGSTCALVSDYLPVMRERLFRPLVERDSAGVKEVVEVYKAYDLLRDDTEAINELGIWPSVNKSHKDISQCVPTKAKSALTRALNKEHRLLPFAQFAPVKGRKKAAGGLTAASLELDEEGNEIAVGGEEDEEDEAGDFDV